MCFLQKIERFVGKVKKRILRSSGSRLATEPLFVVFVILIRLSVRHGRNLRVLTLWV